MLSDQLLDLAKEAAKDIKDRQARGNEIVRRNYPYWRYRVDDFEFSDGFISECGRSARWDTKSLWDLGMWPFIITGEAQYQACVAAIAKRYETSEKQADSWLSRFVQRLAAEVVEIDSVPETLLENWVKTFIGDLDQNPVNWLVEVWLRGVWPTQQQLILANGAILRQPLPTDFEADVPVQSFPFSDRSADDLNQNFSSVLMLTVSAVKPQQIQKELESLITVLRLFKLGSIFPIKYILTTKSILRLGDRPLQLDSRDPIWVPHSYTLNSEDIERFISLHDTIKPLLPDLMNDETPLGIAFQRFETAIFGRPVESQIASAIFCLEALYFTADDIMELKHKLGQRVAILLKMITDIAPGPTIYKHISKAYKIRSEFVHGAILKPNLRKDAPALCEIILDFARMSLLIFLQLKTARQRNGKDKEELINRIDDSLLDDGAREELNDLVKHVIVTR